MNQLRAMIVAALLASIAMQHMDRVAAEICESVSVPDGPCNGKDVGSLAFVPSANGDTFCQITEADCFRFDGVSCNPDACQVYVQSVGPFRGWKLGSSAVSCNTVCGGTEGAAIGCNSAVSAQVIGVQTTVNLLNILGYYTLMNAADFKISSTRGPGSDLPSAATVVVEPFSIATVYYRVDDTNFNCVAADPNPICCCSADPADCLVPSDPQYDVPWVENQPT